MRKNDELKQSKVSRHEVAKEKFRYFERSMSCKSLNTVTYLIIKKGDFVPVPGQFAILSTKKKQQQGRELPSINPNISKPQSSTKQIKFTTNLKLIARQRSPSRVSQLLNQTVNKKIEYERRSLKKITKSQSTGNLRPLTSLSTQLVNDLQGKSSLKQSRMISNAVDHDRKYYIKKQSVQSNTFMVKSRTGIPKHAYGYKSIKLTNQDPKRLKLQSQTKKFTKLTLQQQQDQQQDPTLQTFLTSQGQKPTFLPIEYYMIDDQKPEELIQKYKMDGNYMVGYSKWQDLEGKAEWKKCRVIEYIKDKERWEIEWLHNGKRKIVSRNNLYFENQSYFNFNKILNEAELFRKRSEVYMKYNWLIDNMKEHTHVLEETQLSRIIKLLSFRDSKSTIETKPDREKPLEHLLKEIKEKYIRANHVVMFNAGLPFNVKHKKEFMGYLPDKYFEPNAAMNSFSISRKKQLRSEKVIQTNTEQMVSTKVIPSFELKKLFQTSQKKFNKITPFTSVHKLQILQFLNKTQHQLKTQRISSPHELKFHMQQKQHYPESQLKFYSFFATKSYELKQVKQKLQSSMTESISKMNNVVCEVEYHVAKELDPIYLDKRNYVDSFDDIVGKYRRFLLGVNMRIEAIGRDMLFGMLRQLDGLLRVGKRQEGGSEEGYLKFLEEQKHNYPALTIKVKLQIKGETIQCQPSAQQITQTYRNYIDKLIKQFSTLGCVRKSYIDEIRPNNRMKICQCFEQEQQSKQKWTRSKELIELESSLNETVRACEEEYGRFLGLMTKTFSDILTLQGETRRKAAKKASFNDIEEYLTAMTAAKEQLHRLRMLSVNADLNFRKQDKFKSDVNNPDSQQSIFPSQYTPSQQPLPPGVKHIKSGPLLFSIQQCLSKCTQRLQQISLQLYRIILQKITKQSQRLDKSLLTITEKLQHQPINIKEMITLEQYINEEAAEELYRLTGKINELSDKFKLLEQLGVEIDYKDYVDCHRIYMKPYRVRLLMADRLRLIEGEYRKVFGEELMRDIGQLGGEIKQIEDKFYASISINSIEQMDASFMVFSKLKQRIQLSIGKSQQLNQYQTAMKWITTNFQRVLQIKTQFMPYYQLISLQKNFRFHIQPQLSQNLHLIDAQKLSQQITSGCQQLANLETNVFYNSPAILDIVQNVAQAYKRFREKLPLIMILRNGDLRDRHWQSIKELTGFRDILSDKITFNELEARDIRKYEKKLIEISHIATRQLIYEKRLNRMKKQWKQLKLIFSPSSFTEHSSQSQPPQLKHITNLQQIKTRTETDIYQVQEILSSSFIKFLQKDILNWRNQTLYKMYEFIEVWGVVAVEVEKMERMFLRQAMRNQAEKEYAKYKVLEKNIRSLTMQLEQQPNVLELLQTKINESLKYTLELIEELKKAVAQFFEKKKQRFSRFGSLSQEELMALFSNNDEKEIFDEAVRKCLHGVKNVVRNEKRNITCVKTHLDEEIMFKETDNTAKDMTPDKLIEDIQRRIKRSLRNSIDSIHHQRSGKILQIVLFHQRIIFTRQIQNQLIPGNPGINEGYLNALLQLKEKIIEALFVQYSKLNEQSIIPKVKKQQQLIKIQTELNQLMNHIEIAEHLYKANVVNTFDFQWVKQIRTYQKGSSYFVQIGLNSYQYGFQITDQQQFIVEDSSCKVFFNIAMAMKQRMFGVLKSPTGSGKLSTIHYLANVHGRNQLVLNCHKALSYDNLFDFFRMAANGIWIVFSNISLLSQQVFSCFQQCSQLFWANYPTQKSKTPVLLSDKPITFTTHEICLLATMNQSKANFVQCDLISGQLSSYFRTFDVARFNVEYILESRLVLEGFEAVGARRLLRMVEVVEQECDRFYEDKFNEGLEVYKGVSFSKLNFVNKVIAFAKQVKYNNQSNVKQEDYDILQMGLSKGISQLTRNQPHTKTRILTQLSNHFDFTTNPKEELHQSVQTPAQEQVTEAQYQQLQEAKKMFVENKLYCSKQLVQAYCEMVETLKEKHSVIVLGNCSTGKSTLVKLLEGEKGNDDKSTGKDVNAVDPTTSKDTTTPAPFKMTLSYIHPNAYDLAELFGDGLANGIVNSLIKHSYQLLQKQKQPNHHIGLVFDSEISSWIQPLFPLLKTSSNYIQPNGKNITVNHPLKLIFQCRDVSSVSPSIILSTNIVHLPENHLKWQHIFSQYLKQHFKLYYQKKAFLDYCEVLVTFILEPTLEFFRSSLQSFVGSKTDTKESDSKAAKMPNAKMPIASPTASDNTFVTQLYSSFLKNQLNYIPLVFNLFIALVQSYFSLQKQSQTTKQSSEPKKQPFSSQVSHLEDRQRSCIFSLFLMSITWTLGTFIPEESKKTFSRHFKYLIKRAVQLNIKGIDKESLPKDDEDIYEICFVNGKWYQWDEVPKVMNKLADSERKLWKMPQSQIPLKNKVKYLFLLNNYCSSNLPFFLTGKSSSGKNSLMTQFLDTRSVQTFNRITVACTPLSSHHNAKNQLRKQIEKQKYSHTFKGFVHGKVTLFYICDMNLPLAKNEVSVDEFVNQYAKRQGWYITQSSQFFTFKNIIFCGTLHSSHNFSQHMVKSLNPICYIETQGDIKAKLSSILAQNQILQPYSESIVKLMMNLQEVIGRELRQKFRVGQFTVRDLCDVASGVVGKVNRFYVNAGEEDSENASGNQVGVVKSTKTIQQRRKMKVLLCWIAETQKKYRQKFGNEYEQQKIFYFINNVLMQEQRVRYRNVMPSQNMIVSNLQYYLGRLRTQDSSRRAPKKTKTFLAPSSYKVYPGLQQLNIELEALQEHFPKSQEQQTSQAEVSLSGQISECLKNKLPLRHVGCFVKEMVAVLDYMLEDKCCVMFAIDDTVTPQHPTPTTPASTLQQIFQLKPKQLPRLHAPGPNAISSLLTYTSRINNSTLLTFTPSNATQTQTEWKLFITELFELMNSPASTLYTNYVIVLQGVDLEGQGFVFEELLQLMRTGRLAVLEEFIEGEEGEFMAEQEIEKEVRQKSRVDRTISNQEEHSNGSAQQHDIDDNSKTSHKKMTYTSSQQRHLAASNKTQLIRTKILSKLKFIIHLNQSQLPSLTANYSTLLQKSHLIWSSHLTAEPSTMKDNAESSSSKQIEETLKQVEGSLVANDGKVRKEYNDHKQSLNHFVGFDEVKAVYLALRGEDWQKEQVERVQGEIDGESDIGFLSFLDLCKTLNHGIQSKILDRLQCLQGELNYFTSLDSSLRVLISSHLQAKRTSLLKKQQQVALLAESIGMLSQQNQKFLAYFFKTQQLITQLEKQSRQSNELYHHSLLKEEKNFVSVQFALVDLLKTAKDRKVLLTNQMKLYLEMLGYLIAKKIKPEESMAKEMVKDIAALKVHKKVANLVVQHTLGEKPSDKTVLISQKAIAKLKQFITKNLPQQFTKLQQLSQAYQPKQPKQSFSQSLLLLIRQYLCFLLIYHTKTQEQPIRQLNKKCLKTIKELNRTRDEYHKAQKSKQYEKVTGELEAAKKQRVLKLKEYDDERKDLEGLAEVEQRLDDVVWLNVSGEVEVTGRELLVARVGSIEETTAMHSTKNIPSTRQPTLNQLKAQQRLLKNLLIQKLKSQYMSRKQQMISINNCKDIFSLMIASKLIATQPESIDVGLFTKILSKETLDSLKSLKVDTCRELLGLDGNEKMSDSERLEAGTDRADAVEYLIREFDCRKVLKFIKGLVCVNVIIEGEPKSSRNMVKYDQQNTVTKLIQLISPIAQTQSSVQQTNTGSNPPNATQSSRSNKTTPPQPKQIPDSYLTVHSIPTFHEMVALIKSLLTNPTLSSYLSNNMILLQVTEKLQLSSQEKMKRLLWAAEGEIRQKQGLNIGSQMPAESIFVNCLANLGHGDDVAMRFHARMEARIQQELSQDRKESDIKNLERWRELKVSEAENLVERKQLIHEKGVFEFITGLAQGKYLQTKSQSQRKPASEAINTIQQAQQSMNIGHQENHPQSPITHPRSLTPIPPYLIPTLSTHLSQLKQNLLQSANIASCLESLPSPAIIRRKSNIHSTKLISYLIRVYQGLKVLQSEKVILQVNSEEKFLGFVLWVIAKEKESVKTQVTVPPNKLCKAIKNRVFEQLMLLNNDKRLVVGVVFALAGQELPQKQFEKLVRLIVRLYLHTITIIHVDTAIGNYHRQMKNVNAFQGMIGNDTRNENNQAKDIMKTTITSKDTARQNLSHSKDLSQLTLHANRHLLHNFILRPSQSQPSEKSTQLSPSFQEFLSLLEQSFSCFKSISESFVKKADVWIEFLGNIQTKLGQGIVNTLPEPYNDISRGYFGVFVAVVDPYRLLEWVNVHLVEEDLAKLSSSSGSSVTAQSSSLYNKTTSSIGPQLPLLSTQTLILSLIRSSYKQSLLTSKTALPVIFELGSRQRKQVRLYSPLAQKSQKGQKAVSKKQLSYLTNKRFEQEFVEELYECMKSAGWLVIDAGALVRQKWSCGHSCGYSSSNSYNGSSSYSNSSSGQDHRVQYNNSSTSSIDTSRLQTILLLIQQYTNPTALTQHQQPLQQQPTQPSLSASFKTFPRHQFQHQEYHIFIILPQHLQHLILSNKILKANPQRAILTVAQTSMIQRISCLDVLWHQQLMGSKKLIKQYQKLALIVKQAVYYTLKIAKQSLLQSLNLSLANQCHLNAILQHHIPHISKLQLVLSKVSRLLILLLIQPQGLLDMLSQRLESVIVQERSKGHKQRMDNEEDEESKYGMGRGTRQASRFQQLRRDKEKSNQTRKEETQALKEQSDSSALQSAKSITVGNTNTNTNNNNNRSLSQLLTLIQHYLCQTFTQAQLLLTGIPQVFKHYTQKYLNTKGMRQTGKTVGQKDNLSRLEGLMMVDPNRSLTSNRAVLEEVIAGIKVVEVQGSYERESVREQWQRNSMMGVSSINNCGNSISRNHNNTQTPHTTKLYLERLLSLYHSSITPHQFTSHYHSMQTLLLTSQQSLTQLKQQLFKQPTVILPEQPTRNQFNFSSLTQNLTIDEMRRKLSLTRKPLQGELLVEREKQRAKGNSQDRFKIQLVKRREQYIALIERKLNVVKRVKAVMTGCNGVNYEALTQLIQDQSVVQIVDTVMSVITNSNIAALDRQQQYSLTTLSNINSHLSLSSFFSPGPTPFLNLSLFREPQHLLNTIQLLKQCFIDINNLKNPSLRHYLLLSPANAPTLNKRLVKNPRNGSQMYKICEFGPVWMGNCQLSGQRQGEWQQKNHNSKVKSNGHELVILKGSEQIRLVQSNELKLALYFEESAEGDSSSQSQTSLHDIGQQQPEPKYKETTMPFFLTRLSSSDITEHDNTTVQFIEIPVQILQEKTQQRKTLNMFMFY